MDMESKIKELRQLQALIDEAQAEADAIKDAIKAHMESTGTYEIKTGAYKVTWKAVTSARLDTAALRKAAPELVERFTKQSTARRFCVA